MAKAALPPLGDRPMPPVAQGPQQAVMGFKYYRTP